MLLMSISGRVTKTNGVLAYSTSITCSSLRLRSFCLAWPRAERYVDDPGPERPDAAAGAEAWQDLDLDVWMRPHESVGQKLHATQRSTCAADPERRGACLGRWRPSGKGD